MLKNNFAVVFKRTEKCNDVYILEPVDFVEGNEAISKEGKRKFLVSDDFLKVNLNEETSELFDDLKSVDNIIPFIDDPDMLESEYVYGSPSNDNLFKTIYEGFSSQKVEDDVTIELFKQTYLDALKGYMFFQKCENGKVYTAIQRAEALTVEANMNTLLDEVLYSEFGIDAQELLHAQPKDYNKVFKKVLKKIDIKKIYEETRKYIIGQDEHILSILSGIDDNLQATIPEEKTNILVCGDTGVGKTAIFKRISDLIGLPIVIENATQFTKAGYVGRNIDDIFEDLIKSADNDLELAQNGIIVIDEIDKKASGRNDSVSGVGVLHSMLKLLEGGDYYYEVETGFGGKEIRKFNTLNTTIAFGGAFSGLSEQVTKRNIGFDSETPTATKNKVFSVENLSNYGIPPEFYGRIQLVELLNSLSEKDLKRILVEAIISPLAIFESKMKKHNTRVVINEDFVNAIAREAYLRKTGARSLYSLVKDATKIAEYEVKQAGKDKKELILTEDTVYDSSKYTLRKALKRSK